MRKTVFQLFARQASPLQRRAIEAWLKKPENEELYYEWLEEWERRHSLYDGDSEKRFDEFRHFLEQSEPAELDKQDSQPVPAASSIRTLRTLLAAACVVLIAGFSFWRFSESGQYHVTQTGPNEVKLIKLEDGSWVRLRAHSRLKVPRWGFANNQREIWVSGVADFNITHTATHKPFVVNTAHNWRIVVLGTVFSVRASPRLSTVRLQSGKVRLLNRVGNLERSLLLKPGEIAQLTKTNSWQVQEFIQNSKWSELTEKRFDFRAVTLQQIGQQLAEDYDIRLHIPDQAIAERVLMGSFRARSLDELLQSIAILLNISVERHGNVVIFSALQAQPIRKP